ncbi:MAG: type II secretion system F family protein [Archaeoglobaceae archaeon]
MISVLAIPMIVLNRVSSKKVDIEKRLPLVMAYMAMLASSGTNPVSIIKNVAIKDFGAVSREFAKIVYRIEIVGEDIISAINHLASRTPSKNLSDILIGIANIILSGGDLRTYCEQKSKELFEERRIKLREFIDSLASFSEGYMGGVLVSIVMGVLGIIVIGALGIKIAFFTTSNLLDLLVYFVVPFINILFLALLELKYSKVVV